MTSTRVFSRVPSWSENGELKGVVIMSTNQLRSILHQAERLSAAERVQLIKQLADSLVAADDAQETPRSARELLEKMPGGRVFKISAEADEYLHTEREAWGD